MKVWIFDPTDAIPGEKWGHKHGMFLSRTLAEAGHDVTFWTMNFSHATKEIRGDGWAEIRVEPRILIRLVPVRPYQQHVGATRLLALMDYARGLWKVGSRGAGPDAIIQPLPSPFADVVAVRLAKRHGASLITDFRDLWPEIFESVFPGPLRWLGRLVMKPLYWARKYAFDNSTAFTAVCVTYQDIAFAWSPQLANRPHEILYSTGVELDKFKAILNAKISNSTMISKEAGEFWAIYAGTLGNNYDIPALLEAAALLAKKQDGPRIRIIIAGDGPKKEDIIRYINETKSNIVIYVGALGLEQLYQYYNRSDVGLSIYSPGSTVAIPAKAFDYYAAALPIVNSVSGEFEKFIKTHDIGRQYTSGDAGSLAEAIAGLAADPEALRQMKLRLADLAPEFDRDRQYRKILHLVDQAEPLGRKK